MVEIWEYRGEDQGLECVYAGEAQHDGRDIYCESLLFKVVDRANCLKEMEGRLGPNSHGITSRLYGITEDGSFGLVEELNCKDSHDRETGEYKPVYTLDGKELSDEEVEEHEEISERNGWSIHLTALASSNRSLLPAQAETMTAHGTLWWYGRG